MFARLIANWVYGGFLSALLLLLLTPIIVRSWPVSLVTTFLSLPVYMVHQYKSTTTIGSDFLSIKRLGNKE